MMVGCRSAKNFATAGKSLAEFLKMPSNALADGEATIIPPKECNIHRVLLLYSADANLRSVDSSIINLLKSPP